MRGKALLVLVVALLLGVAAACGGDDESSEEAEPAAVAEEPAAAEEAPADESGDEEASEDDSGGEAAAEDVDIDPEQCAEALGINEDLANAFSSGAAGGEDLEKAADALDEVADNAPDEIKEDFEVLASFLREYLEVVGDVDLASGEQPDPETLQRLQEFAESIDQERLTEAGNAIQAWAAENCQ